MPQIGGVAALAGKRVAVFGAGLEGRCFAERFGPSCAELVLLDDRVPGDGVTGGAEVLAGHESDDFEVHPPSLLEERRFDFVVHSPGVSRYDERLAAALRHGAGVTTPMALFMEDFSNKRVLGVTGSKGKTTTALLSSAALAAYGLDVGLGGNIGRPVTDFYDDDAHDVFVVELSSFQTAELTTSPTVGVLTLLAPDHLDWHRGLENYYADKLALFTQRAGVPVAVNGCCDEAVSRTADLSARVLYGKGGDVVLEGSVVVAAELGELDLDGFRLLGDHNLLNVCGALTAARLLTGELPERGRLEAELTRVTAPRSRLEPLAVVGGIRYVDDALASNPEGTVAALKVFEGSRISLIVGGHDRGVDFMPLARAIESSSPQPVVFLIGEAGARIGAALEDISATSERVRVSSLEEAFDRASSWPEIAAVVFSPAAPTPEEEGTYLERSERFRKLLASKAGETTAGGART